MTTILAIANQKGGVAKTTTTLSLGGALVQMGNEVLMVDLDLRLISAWAWASNPTGCCARSPTCFQYRQPAQC